MADRLARVEKAYRRHPDAPFFARLADLYLRRGKVERALSLCEQGCQRFPDYPAGFLVLSKCYEIQGDLEKARAALDEALRHDQVNPGGYRRLSRIYQQLRVPALALKSLQQAALLDPLNATLAQQVEHLLAQASAPPAPDLPSTAEEPATALPPEVPEPSLEAEEEEPGALPQGPEIQEEPFGQVQSLPEWEEAESPAPPEEADEPAPAAQVADQALRDSAPPAPPFALEADDQDQEPTPESRLVDDEVASLGAEIFGRRSTPLPAPKKQQLPPLDEPPAEEEEEEGELPAPEPAIEEESPEAVQEEEWELPVRADFPSEETDALVEESHDPAMAASASNSDDLAREADDSLFAFAAAEEDDSIAQAQETLRPPQAIEELPALPEEVAAPVTPAPARDEVSGLAASDDGELIRLFQEIETQHLKTVTLSPPSPPPVPEPESQDRQIATVTLAEIYALQGLTQRAIDIYRQLLEQDPDNRVIQRKLSELTNSAKK